MVAVTKAICNVKPLKHDKEAGWAKKAVGCIASKINAQIQHAQLIVLDTNGQYTMFEFGPMEHGSSKGDGEVTIENWGTNLQELDEHREIDVTKQISLTDLKAKANEFRKTQYEVTAVLCQGVAAMSERRPSKPHNCQTFAEYLLHYLTGSWNIVNQVIMNCAHVYHNVVQPIVRGSVAGVKKLTASGAAQTTSAVVTAGGAIAATSAYRTAAMSAAKTAIKWDGGVAVATVGVFLVKDLVQYGQGQITEEQLGRNTAKNLLVGVCGTAGGCVGAAVGAAIGTFICPGIGTKVGGVVGNLIGGVAGSLLGGWLNNRFW